MDKELIQQLNAQFEKLPPHEVLTYFLREYKGRIALSSSLGIEDQALTHMVCNIDNSAKIFTLDTGRLFPETYSLIDKTNKHFDIKIDVYFPESNQVEEMVRTKGINLFYDSIEYRKECCRIRKIEPLKRAFSGLDVWICGLRKDQSITRFFSTMIEVDEANGIVKINPLINWSERMVWDYIRENNIPYNELHDKGFPSIGCQPCTRQVAAGEDIRSGRWWWEAPEHKECGLHKR